MSGAGATREVEVAVFGGGIAGLWTLHSLRLRGVDAVLIEKGDLGGTQTLASQGMIHGGQRYTLHGRPSVHSNLMAKMPALWAACMSGQGDVDLRSLGVVAREQHLWSSAKLTSHLAAFFASKTMRSGVTRLPRRRWPEALRLGNSRHGSVYRLGEDVVDCRSLVETLLAPCRERVYRAELGELRGNADGVEHATLCASGAEPVTLRARAWVFTAGAGNDRVAAMLGLGGRMAQSRPLKQLMVRPLPCPLYAHCITADPRPSVTVTAYAQGDGSYVWYLGGLVAVHGVELDDWAAIRHAERELRAVLPGLAWDASKEWAAASIDRAEPLDPAGHLPEGPGMRVYGNVALAWPTKMTLAPVLTRRLLEWLATRRVVPGSRSGTLPLPRPRVGLLPWEKADWVTTAAHAANE
jgi:glycine/D-amino acid oxidase-like deaminating enzyme